MDIVWSLLERAGYWGWIVAGLGITAWGVAAISAFMGWVWHAPPRRVLTLSATASLMVALVLIVGGVGTAWGYLRVAEVLSYTSGVEAERVARIGPVIARAPVWLALIAAAISAPFLGAAWYRGVADHRAQSLRLP